MKLKALKNINYRDVAIRVGWICLQTFIATFLLAGVNLVKSTIRCKPNYTRRHGYRSVW